jgi:hypothetical protein
MVPNPLVPNISSSPKLHSLHFAILSPKGCKSRRNHQQLSKQQDLSCTIQRATMGNNTSFCPLNKVEKLDLTDYSQVISKSQG